MPNSGPAEQLSTRPLAPYQGTAHIGTYALPGPVKRGAHIAGYALPEIGLWLELEEQNAGSSASRYCEVGARETSRSDRPLPTAVIRAGFSTATVRSRLSGSG